MSTISESHAADASHQPDQPLWCQSCGTNQYLMIETIESYAPFTPNLVEVAYTCAECDSFYAHPATVQQVAAVLNRPGVSFGVLQFGGEYIHCGEPMRTASNEMRTLGDRPLDIYLRTRVLRCACGFQMEIPD